MHPMVLQTYALLFLATTVYAIVLAVFKRKRKAYLTWVEVAFGILICMCAPMWLARVGDIGWQTYEAYAWIAFIIGGLPIAIGETIRHQRTADAAIDEARIFVTKGQAHAHSAEEMAE